MEIEYQIHVVKDKWGNQDCIITDDFYATGQISLIAEDGTRSLIFDDGVNHLKGWVAENDLEYKVLDRTESIDVDWDVVIHENNNLFKKPLSREYGDFTIVTDLFINSQDEDIKIKTSEILKMGHGSITNVILQILYEAESGDSTNFYKVLKILNG